MTSPMMTSQDYLQRLRERRQSKFSAEATVETPAPATEPQVVYQAETQQPQEAVTPIVELPETYLETPVEPQQPAQATAPEIQPQETTPTQPSQDNLEAAQPTEEPVDNATIVWTAPSRPFKKRNARFYTTITVIVALISLILFFAGQFLPIAAVIAVAFLGYVLASVPPEKAKYQISTMGIKIDAAFYHWDEMGYFWMDKKYGQEFIQVEIPRFPFRLILMLGDLPVDEMQKLFIELLPEQQPTLTYMDKVAHWLEKNVLLDEA